jgi:hypothetical protein
VIKRAKRHGVTARFFLVEVTAERLGRIAELFKTRVGLVLPLAAARECAATINGKGIGNVVPN